MARIIIESLQSLVVFCHNDINCGNILKLKDRFMVIDYEYASYNYRYFLKIAKSNLICITNLFKTLFLNRGYDIGNLFNEMMIFYDIKKHPFFKINFEKFPSKSLQLTFIKEYTRKFKETFEKKKQNNYNLDEEQILYEANIFALVSHLFWIMWSLYQSFSSSIEFDYIVSIYL